MTIKAVEWALKREGLSATAKLVLVMLSDCINAADEVAFPSQKRIAEVVGRKERQVRRHIDSLKRAGLIAVIPGAGAGRGKGRQTDHYVIACDHRTGQERAISPEIIAKCGAITGGHSRPDVTVTGGHFEHPVTVTGGHLGQLQAVISGEEAQPLPIAGISYAGARAETPINITTTLKEQEPEEELEPTVSASSETDLLFPYSLSPAKPTTSKERLDGRKALDLYNQAACRRGWCVAKGEPSAGRKQAIRARLREHGMEGWAEQIAIAEEMPFLRGENDRGWRMGIDYFASPRGWAKISEGSFPRGRGKPKNRNGVRPNPYLHTRVVR